MLIISKTKLNYEKMNEMHNLACDFNCMVKVKGAGDIARKAMGVWDGWHSERSKLRGKPQSRGGETVQACLRCGEGFT